MLKVIEKVIKVTKDIEGEVSINGSSPINHCVYERKAFIDLDKANDFYFV